MCEANTIESIDTKSTPNWKVTEPPLPLDVSYLI